MATPKKITMFAHTPDGKKMATAVFRFRDGKVEADWKGPRAEQNREQMETYGVYDKKNKRDVSMDEGPEFMEALTDAFSHSTYVTVNVEE